MIARVLIFHANTHLDLTENHYSVLIIEHDPMRYEDDKEMVEYVAQALKQTSSHIRDIK
jgi:hypothetical protein